MKKTAQWKRKNNGNSGKQNKVMMEYGQLEENQFYQKKYLITIARWFHDKAHGGAEAIAKQVQKVWAAPGIYAAAKRIMNSCLTCQKTLSSKPSSELGGRPWAYFPFQRLQIDYAGMPSANGYKHLLVRVDQLSDWVEAFPTRKADAGGVVKALLREITPR